MKIGCQFGKERYDVLSKMIDLYGPDIAEAVVKKTGPSYLWHAGQEEDTFSLAMQAVENLISRHGIDLQSINNIFSVTETPRLVFPGNASLIASSRLFKENVAIFDLNSGCTGFVDAIKLAMGLSSESLIVCSETYSKHIHHFNRATSSLFSDGAGAVYFKPDQWDIVDSFSLTKANTFKFISVNCKSDQLNMDGKEVFNFVNVFFI
jgi:3-oxoacyl-[acyl-carrier-protein] synthase III